MKSNDEEKTRLSLIYFSINAVHCQDLRHLLKNRIDLHLHISPRTAPPYLSPTLVSPISFTHKTQIFLHFHSNQKEGQANQTPHPKSNPNHHKAQFTKKPTNTTVTKPKELTLENPNQPTQPIHNKKKYPNHHLDQSIHREKKEWKSKRENPRKSHDEGGYWENKIGKPHTVLWCGERLSGEQNLEVLYGAMKGVVVVVVWVKPWSTCGGGGQHSVGEDGGGLGSGRRWSWCC